VQGTLTVLIVEDNPDHATIADQALAEPDRRGRFVPIRVGTLSEALTCLDGGGVDAVLLDLMLPDSQGIETFRRLREHAPDVPVVVASALDDEELAFAAVREGAQDYLVKGAALVEVLGRALRYAVERQRARTELVQERAARAAAEAELRQAQLADRRRRERQEQELRSLERLSGRGSTQTTARAFGVEPLSKALPERFAQLVVRYQQLLDVALDERTYKGESRLSDALREFADQIGFLDAGPRDVVELHTAALRGRIAGAPPRRAQAYVDEARVMVLELMGYLVAYYRV
jgi:DNA-binding response OmpR family regulator